jgi:hypothetical protein
VSYPALVSDERRPRPPADVFLVLRIVHIAMLASLLVYAGVVVLVSRPPPADAVVAGLVPARRPPPASLTWATTIAAVAAVLALILVRRRRASYTTVSITSWALCEAIAVCGLVLAMAHRALGPFVPFGAASLALMVLLAPRRRHLDGP